MISGEYVSESSHDRCARGCPSLVSQIHARLEVRRRRRLHVAFLRRRGLARRAEAYVLAIGELDRVREIGGENDRREHGAGDETAAIPPR